MDVAKRGLRVLTRAFGLDVRRATVRRRSLMADLFDLYAVEAVFDIGANVGMSGEQYRSMGFSGPIVSVEPVGHFFEQLETRASDDPSWHVEKCALGAMRGTTVIRVSGGHGGGSSILEMTENVSEHARDQRVVGIEEVELRTLDALMERYYSRGERAFLKLDVQGYEHAVLMGAGRSLDRIVGMQVEMSLVENYKGETLWFEMIELISRWGFDIVHLNDGWRNSTTRELYQVDVVFFRTRLVGPEAEGK